MAPSKPYTVRPLRRVGVGEWGSRDGRWTFLRHFSDPAPQRWFAYLDDASEAANMGGGQVTLRDVVAFAERQERKCPDEGTCHHGCGVRGCFRVRSCEPLSGVFSGNRWPLRIREALP